MRIIFKNAVSASEEVHCISTAKSSLLMLFREIIAYCENHTNP
jgi:hypothetical protein